MSDFHQEGPELRNQFEDDVVLRSLLRRKLTPEVFDDISPGLRRLGERASGKMLDLARQAEAEPPRHVPYDPWGRRIDRIEVSPAWEALRRIAAEEGVVATAYRREHGALSRLHQFARLYLYHPSSAFYSCPLAMTDGAASTLELHADDALRQRVLTRLTSTDPERFWTSGQWMTERTGGSDVSGTSTVARRADPGAQGADRSGNRRGTSPGDGDQAGEPYRLHGTKWFTSATNSEVALTLARLEGAPEGSRGLSMFLVELRDAHGALRGIRVNRLKDKLGTRALPTAELTLDGAPATMIGEPGRGVRTISTVLNITRLYNACCAAATMRRGLALARDYADKRVVFGKPLSEHPLHVETLATLDAEFRGGFHLAFRSAELLGRVETEEASEEEANVLRLLTPLAKLYTAKQAIAVTSEVLECFGGAGYIEDTGLPVLLRDAQVLSIWEGTTNVLTLDALRAMRREGVLAAFLADVHRLAGSVVDDEGSAVEPAAEPLAVAARGVLRDVERLRTELPPMLETAGAEARARQTAYALSRACARALMLEHAAWQLREDPSSGATGAAVAAARRGVRLI